MKAMIYKNNCTLPKEYLEQLNLLEVTKGKIEDIVLHFKTCRLSMSYLTFFFTISLYLILWLIMLFIPPYNISSLNHYVVLTFSILFGFFPYIYSRQRFKMDRFSAIISATAFTSLIIAIFEMLL